MVEFYDPIAKKEIGYHIAPAAKRIWDKLRDGGLAKLNEDRVYLVDGREGTGKSSFTFQQAKYINPHFNVDFICFEPRSFLDLLKNSPKGSVIVFDEAFRGLSSKSSRSKVNKEIVEALMEVRQKNFVIFIVLPTIFLLEIYAAVFRSESLLHIYKLKKETASGRKTRAFKVYNYINKKKLYLRGKTKYFSYAYPKIRRAKGEFYVKINKNFPQGTPYETFELEKYLDKKDEAFKRKEKEEESEEKHNTRLLNNIMKWLLDDKIFGSQSKLSKWFDEHGYGMNQAAVSQRVRKAAGYQDVTTK